MREEARGEVVVAVPNPPGPPLPGDAPIVISNLNDGLGLDGNPQGEKEWTDGDFNGDQLVTISVPNPPFPPDPGDYSRLLFNLNGLTIPDHAAAGTATAVYDPVTGQVIFHTNGQITLFMGSASNSMLLGGNSLGGAIDEFFAPGSLSWAKTPAWGDGSQDAGLIVQPGTPIGDLSFFYINDGETAFLQGDVIPDVPEPSSIVMMVLGMASLWMMRRRRV